MAPPLQLHELSIVIRAENHNPTILNPDFLRLNGIASPEWELAGNPVCTDPISRVEFKNGLTIVAQLDRIVFAQHMLGRKDSEAIVAGVAQQYIATLPHVPYTALGINPKGHMSMATEDDAKNFVAALIADGPWKEWRGEKARASVKLSYPIEGGFLHLTIDAVTITLREEDLGPQVLFAANFHRDLPKELSGKEKISQLSSLVRSWQDDLQAWRELIDGSFLQSEVLLQ